MPRRPPVPVPNPRHERWRRAVAEQERSGLTQHQFCDANAIAYSSFTRWRRHVLDERLAGRAEPAAAATPTTLDPPAFVAVDVAGAAAARHVATGLSVTLPSGVRISGIGADTVTTVAALVAAL